MFFARIRSLTQARYRRFECGGGHTHPATHDNHFRVPDPAALRFSCGPLRNLSLAEWQAQTNWDGSGADARSVVSGLPSDGELLRLARRTLASAERAELV